MPRVRLRLHERTARRALLSSVVACPGLSRPDCHLLEPGCCFDARGRVRLASMGDIVRALGTEDLLLGVWCNECLRAFRAGDVVVIESGKAARHKVCVERPTARH